MDELREKYLQGKLTESEKKSFEESLSKDDMNELAHELGVQDGIQFQLRSELRSKVVGYETKNARVRKYNPAFIGIAASLLLMASFILYFNQDQKSLFDQYYQPYPNYELTTVRGDDDLTIREQAYAAYDIENFQKTISEFNKLETLIDADYFFRGISYMEVEKYDLALTDFESVINTNDKDYEAASTWYSALIHIKQEKTEMAIPFLKKLSKGNSEYVDSATQLLSEL